MGANLMPAKSLETRRPFQATNHREFYSYPRQVQRVDRELDAHLGRVFTVLLKIAVRDSEDLGREAHAALLGLVRAKAALKMLRTAPVKTKPGYVAPWLIGLDVIVTPTLNGQHERPIEPPERDSG